ncbi:hypothetical protein [Fodinibius halophilus]|uniref:Thioredoxin domain-containing protein n=1 Tax=Fodinibius halophilus TaxID=1736908 RepID=A0A6M1T9K9_9BACT|nr:hypothetical protein [Fodinibius halophilus]NGP88721.1 hypothetical protein [Fodinibius halophilus]
MAQKEKVDWLTYGLVALAIVVVGLTTPNFFNSEVAIPAHDKVHNWDTLRTSYSPLHGNGQSQVIIIEYYSYGCGYCRVLDHSLSKL